MYLQLPPVLHGAVGYLRVLCPAAHVLAGVAHGGDVVDDAEGDVAVRGGLGGGRAEDGHAHENLLLAVGDGRAIGGSLQGPLYVLQVL